MDASALIVIAVSGAVGGAALWIGAGWLREAARQQRRERISQLRTAQFKASIQSPLPAKAETAATAAPRPAPPVLHDTLASEASTQGTTADTAWQSTNFPATQPMAPSGFGRPFAETEPMPLK